MSNKVWPPDVPDEVPTETQELRDLVEVVYFLALDGSVIEGLQHKQWYLHQILVAIIGEDGIRSINEALEGVGGLDEGVSPYEQNR